MSSSESGADLAHARAVVEPGISPMGWQIAVKAGIGLDRLQTDKLRACARIGLADEAQTASPSKVRERRIPFESTLKAGFADLHLREEEVDHSGHAP